MAAICIACAAALLAHNPDTSYARIRIAENKVETRLTYDVFTLLKIIPLDDNRDGKLQRTELAAHAPQIAEFLRSKIGLATSDADDSADLGAFQDFLWPPDIGDSITSADYHSANGLIHFDFTRNLDQPPTVVAIAFGFFDTFTDRHTILGVFECRGDKYETTFNHIEDSFEYSTGYVGLAVPTTPGETAFGAVLPTPPRPQTRHTLSERTWRFFKLGVEHIFLGYDHIAFLIALIVVSRFREIAKIVTSFTIAHSITLILAALNIVHLPSRLIEASIALTILYVALENLWLLPTPHSAIGAPVSAGHPHAEFHPSSFILHPFPPPRWLLTFFFGLIHGFGFANVLRELGLPTEGLVICLLSFNIGVEFGQLAIALCLLPLAWFLSRWKHGRLAATLISLLLATFGLAWFLDRTFNLELMQRLGL